MLAPDCIPVLPGLIVGLALTVLVIVKGWWRA